MLTGDRGDFGEAGPEPVPAINDEISVTLSISRPRMGKMVSKSRSVGSGNGASRSFLTHICNGSILYIYS